MIISKNTNIVSKIKFSFEFDDATKKDIYLKSGDIVLIKFLHENDVITQEGKVTDIEITDVTQSTAYSNINQTYEDAIITLDCSKFYDQNTYKIFARNILDFTVIRTDAELKGEPGETQDLTEILNRLAALETECSELKEKVKLLEEQAASK